MIEIDGSHGEGGGSILRQALSLSLYTGKSFRIKNIRKNRPKKGLSAQHLKSIELAVKISGSKVSGNFLGSQEVVFIPSSLSSGKNIELDIATAGSVTLTVQSILLPCIFSEHRFKFKLIGGTDVKWAPPADFYEYLLFPNLRPIAPLESKIIRRGYYPKGKGIYELKIGTSSFSKREPIELEGFPKLVGIQGICHASKDFIDERLCEKVVESLPIFLSNTPQSIKISYSESSCKGAGLFLFSVLEEESFEKVKTFRMSGSSLWEPSLSTHEFITSAVDELKKEIDSGSVADKYLSDQLIPFIGVLGGKIRVSEITNHLLSNINIVEKFLGVQFIVDMENKVISLN